MMQLIDFAEYSAFIDTNIFLYRYSNASLSSICEEIIGLVNSTVLNDATLYNIKLHDVVRFVKHNPKVLNALTTPYEILDEIYDYEGLEMMAR
ncbi:MAG: hypothetical protein ACE5J9_02040 [Methanosarcinales archaeon]